MSSIPTSAIPHARDDSTTSSRRSRTDRFGEMVGSARRWTGERYDSASRAVRNDPKIAAAAGATVLAAIAAVFAPRLWRQRASFGL